MLYKTLFYVTTLIVQITWTKRKLFHPEQPYLSLHGPPHALTIIVSVAHVCDNITIFSGSYVRNIKRSTTEIRFYNVWLNIWATQLSSVVIKLDVFCVVDAYFLWLQLQSETTPWVCRIYESLFVWTSISWQRSSLQAHAHEQCNNGLFTFFFYIYRSTGIIQRVVFTQFL